MSAQILVYPLELNSVSTSVVGAQAGRPMIRFQSFGAEPGSSVAICMPIPQNISFADIISDVKEVLQKQLEENYRGD